MKNVTLSGLFIFALAIGTAFGASATARAQTPAADWNGLYAGINVGVARNQDTGLVECVNGSGVQNGNGCFVQAYGKINKTGGVFGGQLGYNWQFNHFVVGPEVDLDTSTLTGNVTFGGPIVCISAGTLPGTFHASETLGTLESGRIRLGYAFSPKALLYVAGGYARAFGNVQSAVTYSTNAYVANNNIEQNGTSEAVGAEWKVDPKTALRLELTDFNFDPFTTNAPSTPIATTFVDGKVFVFHTWVLRGGVDLKI